jgi:hypothetical protein
MVENLMAGTPFVENTTICVTRDDSDTKPERLPCQTCDSLKREPAVVMCTIQRALRFRKRLA